MLDYQLLIRDDEPEFAEIQASIQYNGGGKRSKYHERCLICDGVMTCNEEQHQGDKAHKTLRYDKLCPVRAQSDDIETSDLWLHSVIS